MSSRATAVPFFCLSVALVAASGRAWGQPAPPPPALRAHVYSPYEQVVIDQALKDLHATRDPAPEGKTVERIEIVPLDVIDERDPVPNFVNIFHATTRKYIVRREVLVQEGEPYRQVLLDETIRNLRAFPQISVVIVVPVQGSAPDRVGIIVITKDVWSLRPNWGLQATNGGIQLLEFQPAETNLLGTHQTLIGNFALEPEAYTFGGGYRIPRLAGTRIAVLASANVMVNRDSGSPEGSYGSLVAGQPLYSGLTEWAWDGVVSWQNRIQRRYVDARLSLYPSPTTGQKLPFQYDIREYATGYEVTRSFGWDIKHDITFAAGIDLRSYRTDFPGFDPRSVADFVRDNVPVSDTRVGPSIQYHSYTKRYLRVIDFETLGLQEDYRLGHDIYARVYPSFRALGSTRDVLGLYAAAMYTFPLRDGLARIAFESTTEPEVDRIADANITPNVRIVSPTIGKAGRFVFDALLLYRWRNYLNATSYLGGESRLRGYPTNFFVGKDVMSYNLEFRTHPVEILTLQAGAVAFYDVGEAFNGFDHSGCSELVGPRTGSCFQPVQSVGFGFRGMFPQFDRVVYRVDVGFPLLRPVDPTTGQVIPPVSFFISLGQAFSIPEIGPRPVLPSAQ